MSLGKSALAGGCIGLATGIIGTFVGMHLVQSMLLTVAFTLLWNITCDCIKEK